MAQDDPVSASPPKDVALAATEATIDQAKKGLEIAVERVTPWLVEIGDWIFAGLIAFNVVILAPLMTVASVDRAITIATAAFAFALPLDLAGLLILRLVRDAAHVSFTEEWARAFREAGFPIDETTAPPHERNSHKTRRTRRALTYSFSVLVLSVVLTLAGLSAALWHVAGWIGGAFVVVAFLSAGLVISTLVAFGSPESPEQRDSYRRYWNEMMRRAKERSKPKNESA
jgi:hypothetical protein